MKPRESSALAAILLLCSGVCGQGRRPAAAPDPALAAEVRALAQLLDENEYDQAVVRTRAMEPSRFVAILRAGILGTERPRLLGLAHMLKPEYLDRSEMERLVEIMLPRVPEPSTSWLHPDILGSSELERYLGHFPLRHHELDAGQMLARVSGHVRANHLPVLCGLSLSDDQKTRNGAFQLLLGALEYTDRHRELVAGVVLALRPDADAIEPADVNPHGITQKAGAAREVPPDHLLPEVLQQVFLSSKKTVERRMLVHLEGWAMRWALAQAAELDGALLEKLAACPLPLAKKTAIRALGVPGSRASAGALRDFAAEETDRKNREIATLALGSQARRGDADAVESLVRLSARDALALAALMEAAPARAALVLRDRILGADASAASGALDFVGDVIDDDVAATQGMSWPREVFAGLEDGALAAGLEGTRLARIAQVVPGCRTARLAKAALAKLDRPETARACRQLLPFLHLLEVCAPADLRALLRAWSESEVEEVRDFALQSLLVLGDPRSAMRLLTWVVEGKGSPSAPHRSPTTLLALSASPELEEILRVWIHIDRGPKGRTKYDAAAALAIVYGIPPEVGPLFEDDQFAAETWPRIRDLVVAKRPIEALVEYLRGIVAGEARPDLPRVKNLGLVKDQSLKDLLLEIRNRRELGLYAWATGELAAMGDRAARAEMWSVFQSGRLRWIESAEVRALTLGHDLKTIPFWLEELESNSTRHRTVATIFENLFALKGFSWVHGRCEIPSQRVRRWWSENGNRLAWSRLAGHFVPGVE